MIRWIRRAVTAIVMALLCIGLCAQTVFFPRVRADETVLDENGLSALQAIVYDTSSGEILFRKTNSTGKLYPASTTKLFSAFVALQYLQPEELITAGDELEFVADDASLAYIFRGQTLTVSMLVEGMMLPSGNDAAYVLAAGAGRKIAQDPQLNYAEAVHIFVDQMNATARELGLHDSHFMNPDGYHVGSHYTSVSDMVRIAELALGNPTIAQHAAILQDDVTYASGEIITWYNTNSLLDPESQYYRQDACGLKTGLSDNAGHCLVSAFRRDSGYRIIAVFGCPDSSSRMQDIHTLLAMFE